MHMYLLFIQTCIVHVYLYILKRETLSIYIFLFLNNSKPTYYKFYIQK